MFGIMIQTLRKQHKLSQSELGEKLGIGVSSVSMWESERRSPSVENIMALSDIFSVSTDYILYGEKEDRSLSKDELDLVDLYAQLSETEKAEVKGLVRGILLSSSKKNRDNE